MTTKSLEPVDFMMMDVHRPLTDEEISEVNPQALVDKSLGTEQDNHGDEAGVGAPHEARCIICFGPTPCAEHANVEQLGAVTSLDISATTVLAAAHGKGLAGVVIVGMLEDGREYFASSIADAAESIYHLQRGIHKLNRIVDEAENDDPA